MSVRRSVRYSLFGVLRKAFASLPLSNSTRLILPGIRPCITYSAIAKREIEDNFAAAEEEGEEKEMAEKAFDEMLQEEDMKDLMMEEEREAGVVAE